MRKLYIFYNGVCIYILDGAGWGGPMPFGYGIGFIVYPVLTLA